MLLFTFWAFLWPICSGGGWVLGVDFWLGAGVPLCKLPWVCGWASLFSLGVTLDCDLAWLGLVPWLLLLSCGAGAFSKFSWGWNPDLQATRTSFFHFSSPALCDGLWVVVLGTGAYVHGSAVGKNGSEFSGFLWSNSSIFLASVGQSLSQLEWLLELHDTHHFLFCSVHPLVMCTPLHVPHLLCSLHSCAMWLVNFWHLRHHSGSCLHFSIVAL